MSERFTERDYLYWLCQIPPLGAVSIQALLDRYQTCEAVYQIEGSRLAKERLISQKAAECFEQMKPLLGKASAELAGLALRGIRFVTILDPEYPERLKHIYGKPVGLYVKGRIPDDLRPSVAIIGARAASDYGLQIARMLGASLSRAGVQIISGMALGVDGAGHEGALMEEGDTYAVLGSGVDVCYPRTHLNMYLKIPERGGLISEFPLGSGALKAHFPMRNRLISGLADVIIVVEAREKSGSLITAELALEQGREVMAVPGMVTSELSRGCNQLIRQGAGIVTSPDDILEYFQIKQEKMLRLPKKNENALAKKEKIVYSCLDLQPRFIDQVVEMSGLPLGECMTILLELELKGYVVQPTGHYYVKKI